MVEFAVVASFMTLSWFGPWFSLGHNNASPMLKMDSNQVIYRALFSETTLPLEQIESVDIALKPELKTYNLYLNKKGGVFVPAFNLGSPEELKRALQQFKLQNVRLSEGAAGLLAEASKN